MSLPPEGRFSATTTVMVDLIYYTVGSAQQKGFTAISPEFVKFVGLLISKYPHHDLIQGFIENSYGECWDKIKVRDISFFEKNAADIFKYLPSDKVNMFRDLFVGGYVNKETETKLWDLFTSMVKISINYIHETRGPKLVDGKNIYRASFFDEVDIGKYSTVFGMKLMFPQ